MKGRDSKRFAPAATPDTVPRLEESIASFWQREGIFEKSVEMRSGAPDFVFYEGPPTANGEPGVHHVIARVCKDIVCRYRTMRGYRVVRKAGWDTHGLPVEIEVENQLGMKSKDEIEQIGIERFNALCKESVFKYEKEWERFTRRIGFWLDLEHPYVTCTNEYIESVWWILKEFWKAGLLYEGHKIVPYCPRCGTSLSSHEVSQGYRDVSDPSIFVKFKATESDEYFLVWTTTPWTLISNAALAVGPDFDYVRVEHGEETLILAEARLGVLEGEYRIAEKFKGRALEGKSYEPLFPFFRSTEGAFIVRGAGFVSLEEGTGIVHIAPAFGEDDYSMHKAQGVPLFQPVTPLGTFSEEITPWAGRDVKEADPSIIKDLQERGLLYKSDRVKHSYPFCWRCHKALIYYARKSWYIKTTSFKEKLISANKRVAWIPPEVGESRFGNWLEGNVDWALSRERYWGTPLNIWMCEGCGKNQAVGSIEELEKLSTNFPASGEIDLHRPAVDGLVLRCPGCGGDMRRVAEVIDCWFDSGSMPFAQYHYPFDEEGMFEGQFPADFICEGVDQSRGWFYSLLVIGAFIKGVSPYRNVLTTGMILDKEGQKMSKSRGNAIEPWDVLDREGADALRWYLVTTSPPWMPTRFDRKGVVEAAQKLMGTLRNVYSFFGMYAEIDRYRYGDETGQMHLLDRWLLSRYGTVASRVRDLMDGFDLTRAARLLTRFVLDELSNWYVRRSRRRFWKGEMGPDKVAAYRTLYTVLKGLLKLLSPFVPFVCEELYLNLKRAGVEPEDAYRESVHLEDYPEIDRASVDEELEDVMDLALRVSSLGRTVRNEAGIKIRQPLSRMALLDAKERVGKLIERPEVAELVLEELHVKALEHVGDLSRFVTLAPKPNYPVLGKKFAKRVPEVVSIIESLPQEKLLTLWRNGEIEVGGMHLTREDFDIEARGLEGFGAREERGLIVVLDLAISEDLKMEGIAREIVNRIQNMRKKAGLEVTDRIRIRYKGGAMIEETFSAREEFIRNETLAMDMELGESDWPNRLDDELEGEKLSLWIAREM